jgi:hypothetical protein
VLEEAPGPWKVRPSRETFRTPDPQNIQPLNEADITLCPGVPTMLTLLLRVIMELTAKLPAGMVTVPPTAEA